MDLPEHVAENRRFWDEKADWWVKPGERAWTEEPNWGIWHIPESELHLLPDSLDGKRAIELGCGTAYVSAWLARRGASAVGIDNSARQLETAKRLSQQHDIAIEFIHGNAETVPLPDASFDFAISEYGAALWCDPRVWIPEAHRLLKPSGELSFLTVSSLLAACMPTSGNVGERLLRPTFELRKQDWREAEEDPGGIEFNLPTSTWFRLLRDTGFEVLDFVELRAPETAEDTPFHVTAAWGRAHPAEQAWRVKKR